MFDPGKILKVKVEIAPGSFGYGRATIVDKAGSQLIIQIKTAKEGNKFFPKGTRLWFTTDSPKVTFNGMWASSVAGSQLVQGKTMLVVTAPKHEPLEQKRSWPRVAVEMPVKMTRSCHKADGGNKSDDGAPKNISCSTADLSRSGLTLEFTEEQPQPFEAGEEVALVLQSKELDIAVVARVIRVDRHWIANKTVLGLEFVNLEPPAQTELDRVLVPLGGRPRNPELEEKARQAQGSGMSSWSKTIQGMSSFAMFEDHESKSDSDSKSGSKSDADSDVDSGCDQDKKD